MKNILMFLVIFAISAPIYGEFGKVDIHGFISQGFLQTNDNNYLNANTQEGSYEFNEMGLNVGTDLTDNLRLGMQFFAKDLGKIGNDEIKIDWAFVDYNYRNWLGLRVGKMKRAAGLYNQSRDIDVARTSILLPQSLYNENFRSTVLAIKGFSLYGMLPYGFEYQFFHGTFGLPLESGTIERINNSAIVGAFGAVNDTEITDKSTLHLMWNTPLEGLKVGGSYYEYEFSIFTSAAELIIESNRYILSAEYMWENIILSAEYIAGTDEVSIPTFGIDLPDTDVEGFYYKGSYRFTDYFELGAYYSTWFPSTDKRGSDNYHKDFALSTRFDINDSWILKLEGHYINGVAEVDPSTKEIEDEWYLFATKLTFSF